MSVRTAPAATTRRDSDNDDGADDGDYDIFAICSL